MDTVRVMMKASTPSFICALIQMNLRDLCPNRIDRRRIFQRLFEAMVTFSLSLRFRKARTRAKLPQRSTCRVNGTREGSSNSF